MAAHVAAAGGTAAWIPPCASSQPATDGWTAWSYVLCQPIFPPVPCAGLVRNDWPQQFPNNAVVGESLVSIVVRAGNPKNIRGWDDLGKLVPERVPEQAAE